MPNNRLAAALVCSCLIAMLAAAALAPSASADGDPASDALLVQSVFYPYSSPVSKATQGALNAATAAARRAHLTIRTALIAKPEDLGSITALFGKPQGYAEFLDREISFQGKQRLLVVMPDGYGLEGFGSAGQQALRSLARPSGRTTTDLAVAATMAIARLTAVAGRTRSAPAQTAGGSGSTARMTVLIVLLFAAVIVATMLLVLRLVAISRSSKPR